MNSTKNDTDTRIDNLLGNPHKTILFNDNHHSTIEVTEQIVKAIHCTASKAAEIMMTAHNTGSAIVFTGSLERCEHVSSILEQIGLATSVEEA